ncbi:hypothetical protein TNCV_4695721 [Trichonephila clavipes]|nr:hypothetical protein TNCV_4695721 [Trichonephila clavipes]
MVMNSSSTEGSSCGRTDARKMCRRSTSSRWRNGKVRRRVCQDSQAQRSSGSVLRFRTTGPNSISELGKDDSAFHPHCSGSTSAHAPQRPTVKHAGMGTVGLALMGYCATEFQFFGYRIPNLSILYSWNYQTAKCYNVTLKNYHEEMLIYITSVDAHIGVAWKFEEWRAHQAVIFVTGLWFQITRSVTNSSCEVAVA